MLYLNYFNPLVLRMKELESTFRSDWGIFLFHLNISFRETCETQIKLSNSTLLSAALNARVCDVVRWGYQKNSQILRSSLPLDGVTMNVS